MAIGPDMTPKANRVRSARAQLKQKLRAGELTITDVLRHRPIPDWLEKAEVRPICEAQRMMGPAKVEQAFRRCGIPYSLRFDQLTIPQAEGLIRWLEQRHSKALSS